MRGAAHVALEERERLVTEKSSLSLTAAVAASASAKNASRDMHAPPSHQHLDITPCSSG
jgi:hypothetical protein